MKNFKLRNEHLSPAKLTIVDGFPSGGKNLVSSLVSNLKNHDMWTSFYPLETVSYCQSLGLIDSDAAKMIVLKELDCITRDQLFSRRVNLNLRDLSGLRNYRGWADSLRKLSRSSQDLKLHNLDEASYYSYGRDFAFYTHLNTQNLSFCFDAFGKKLNYIWVVPNFFVLNFYRQLSHWIQRWAKGDATVFFLEKRDSSNIEFPCILASKYVDDFIEASDIGKAVILTRSILEETLSQIDSLFKRIKTPNFRVYKFENLVADPHPYLSSIENLTGSHFPKSIFHEMKKQNIPRARAFFEIEIKDYQRQLENSLVEMEGLYLKKHFEAICDSYSLLKERL